MWEIPDLSKLEMMNMLPYPSLWKNFHLKWHHVIEGLGAAP